MRKLGIIAGEGALPLALETWARRRRIPFVVARIRTRDGGCELGSFAMSDISGVINLFKAKGVDTVVMAGGIYYARVGFSLKLLEFAARLLFVRNRYDGVLRLVIAEFEKNGFRVVGVQELAPELLAGRGVLGRVRPSALQMAEIRRTLPLARDFAASDRGQACVVLHGKIVVCERFSGTDKMIKNAGKLPGAILIKLAKPGQDLRADAPVIGVQTVELAAANGYIGIAVDGVNTIIENRKVVLEAADRFGLFIVGI